MADQPNPPLRPIPSGPLDRETALAILRRADDLMEAGEPEQAAGHYQRVIGFDEPAVTASALFGLGNAFYRLDREGDAGATWQAVLALPETPSTYLAWRQIAALRVRDGDLPGAIKAYREADRRAPAQDKAEIASRLGWLAKETGDTRGAARQFRRSRGGSAVTVTYAIIAVTVIVSFTAWFGQSAGGLDIGPIYPALWLDKADIAAGQLWRLFTVALVHSPGQTEFFLHLGFNMYALYLVGPVVEQIYGARRMLLMYVACAATGSTLSFILGPDGPGVGASGAIFGLFGVLLVASRIHHPVVDRRSRAILGQVGMLIVFNLVLGFGLGGAGVVNIDNFAHVGGLLGGLWLGLILLPNAAPTLSSFWHQAAGSATPGKASPMLQVVGVAALVVVVAVGLVIGTDSYRQAREVGLPAVTIQVAHNQRG
ncbi:MAG TPA: rhomboid family intramembrane serine protease [Candidatus Acidoferrum sp.]|nr:rhomboid family intramembrane serine protease [Candidatus Acidoferrum sp.]